MELKISDLLDELEEVPVDILPYTAVSESQIKELTMRKIHEQGAPKVRRWGSGIVSKILVAAVIVTALTVTVMAATGTQFEDWIAGLEKPKEGQYSGYDTELLMGGSAYYWEVSNWMLHIDTVDAAAAGMTVDCMEYGSAERTGTLTMDGVWWLEKWNGSGYEPIDAVIPVGEQVRIEKQSKYRWHADWGSSHGELSAGSYRLGIPFTYTAEDGTIEELKCYAKFRIFSKEMDGYIKKCNHALEARYKQEIMHYRETHYINRTGYEYAYYTQETWKHGDDYLEVTSYFYEDGRLHDRRGHLRHNGVGYILRWADQACDVVAQWERATYVDDDDVTYGFYLRGDVLMPVVGEIWDDGNTIYVVNYYDPVDESLLSEEEIRRKNEENPLWYYNYGEQVYTFDDSGNLVSYENITQTARSAEESERATTYKFEVFDTDPEEIRKMIDKQNVSVPEPFSWSEDQARYGENAVTEGFRNTTAQKITCADDAVNIARNEAVIAEHPAYREGDEYNVAIAYYDGSADVWKVVFRFSQDDDKKIYVYLSSDGITLMTVYP